MKILAVNAGPAQRSPFPPPQLAIAHAPCLKKLADAAYTVLFLIRSAAQIAATDSMSSKRSQTTLQRRSSLTGRRPPSTGRDR
eukprot:47525-Eustigmatos_ZCMA.PRE.2